MSSNRTAGHLAAADPAVDSREDNSSAGMEEASSEIERETPSFSPEEVAERVYRIFCENLRRERERRGYWE